LTWPNKDQFLLVPKDDFGKPVWVEPDHPAASEVRLADFTGSHGVVDSDNPCADNLVGPAWRPGGSHRAQPPGDDAPLSVGETARRTCHADIGSRGPHMLWEA
jgi:hypothetical protein